MQLRPDKPHPDYQAQADHYEMVADFYRGVGAVRAKGERYLPKTAGMRHAPDPESMKRRYDAFVGRATFPGIFRQTVSAIVGITTQKEPQEIVIPSDWADLEAVATRDGDGLRGLQAKLIAEVSTKGRVGVLTDLRSDVEDVPVLVPFYAEQIINWRTSIIDGKVRPTLLALKKLEAREGDNFWEDGAVECVEVYQLAQGGVVLRKFEKQPGKSGDSEWIEVAVPQPRTRRQLPGTQATQDEGGRVNGFRLSEIPFTSITAKGLMLDPVDPPFIDLCYKLQDIFVGSANYREAMSMYEPTPVITGMTAEWLEAGFSPSSMGVGVMWNLPAGADAKMIEYTGPTIANIRQCLIDDAMEAERLAAQPFESITSQAESGEAKKQRAQAKANVIREIHMSVAQGIQEALRKGARWIGQNDEDIYFTVADDLDNAQMAPDELRETTAAWISGAITDSDLHALLKKGGKTMLTFEEWQAERDGGLTGSMPEPEPQDEELPPGAGAAFLNG